MHQQGGGERSPSKAISNSSGNLLRTRSQPSVEKRPSWSCPTEREGQPPNSETLQKKTSLGHLEDAASNVASGRLDLAEVLKKRESLRDIGNKGEVVQRKFISTWRLACDKTRDRTKELLKKWRTLPDDPEQGPAEMPQGAMDHNKKRNQQQPQQQPPPNQHRWSVHVWTTWVKRCPSEEDTASSEDLNDVLTPIQKEKLTHFFSHIFDTDRDSVITLQDFESFTERVRHFTDWTSNCGEYLVLQQVQQGFVEAFLAPNKSDNCSDDAMVVDMYKQFLSLEDWLKIWSRLLAGIKNIQELPIWLQYFPKIVFQAINKSGSGRISRDELSAFYSSMMGFSAQRVGEILDEAYKAMTANGDCTITYPVYRLCFANFLLGRFPNGPGHYVFGLGEDAGRHAFPVDYSAMNTAPEDREQYSQDGKTNRRSIVV